VGEGTRRNSTQPKTLYYQGDSKGVLKDDAGGKLIYKDDNSSGTGTLVPKK
jgi:hypothetical protein